MNQRLNRRRQDAARRRKEIREREARERKQYFENVKKEARKKVAERNLRNKVYNTRGSSSRTLGKPKYRPKYDPESVDIYSSMKDLKKARRIIKADMDYYNKWHSLADKLIFNNKIRLTELKDTNDKAMMRIVEDKLKTQKEQRQGIVENVANLEKEAIRVDEYIKYLKENEDEADRRAVKRRREELEKLGMDDAKKMLEFSDSASSDPSDYESLESSTDSSSSDSDLSFEYESNDEDDDEDPYNNNNNDGSSMRDDIEKYSKDGSLGLSLAANISSLGKTLLHDLFLKVKKDIKLRQSRIVAIEKRLAAMRKKQREHPTGLQGDGNKLQKHDSEKDELLRQLTKLESENRESEKEIEIINKELQRRNLKL